ncbi:uncharacterized protein LOC143568261 [Bidens hawaiensis]|uniref:uncharacterized protein LOC143568261 n=1 Tax=Bidens hawaiensis TaxID=980011 RepID=UPI00404B5663
MDDKAKGGHKFYNLLLKSMSLQLHLLFLLPVALILTFTSYNNYYYLSAFVIPLFTHTFEKKYIFLLCSTILTFITKNINIFGLKDINVDHVLALDAPLLEGDITIEQAPDYEQESMEAYKETVGDNNITIERAPEYEQESMKAYKETLMDDNQNDEIERDNPEDDGEEQGCVDMDTEELNKKIEEFIRKMRQDLKLELEAKHQLITVNYV